jgi:predicted glycosyltransferase involved in capsule biosynthesis
MGAMALHGYSSMELKSRSFTSKEPHVAREPQVADPWSSQYTNCAFLVALYTQKNISKAMIVVDIDTCNISSSIFLKPQI